MVKMTLNELSQELTAKELRELEAAEKKEPVFDDDSPALMREQLMQFKRINHQNRTKPTISLRISPATLKKAKQRNGGTTLFVPFFASRPLAWHTVLGEEHAENR